MTMRVRGERRAGGRTGRALALIGLLAGGAACVTPPRRPIAFPADHTVNVVFADVAGARCPVQALPQGGVCPPSQPQCPIRVRFKYGAAPPQVLFQATDASGAPTRDKLAVQFDPFQGPPGQGEGFVLLTVRMDAKQGTVKTFPYNVQSGTCTPLDPDVQVEW
jgi:hypothetical protein